ncbi:hypothetical protein KR009_001113 [Drosophila setifemur]|nr:hypothetical protein KR009_001113 [Drosophila setifemur]
MDFSKGLLMTCILFGLISWDWVLACTDCKCFANETLPAKKDEKDEFQVAVVEGAEGEGCSPLEEELKLLKEIVTWPLNRLGYYLKESTSRFRDNMLILGEIHRRRNRIVRQKLRNLEKLKKPKSMRTRMMQSRRGVILRAIHKLAGMPMELKGESFENFTHQLRTRPSPEQHLLPYHLDIYGEQTERKGNHTVTAIR